jgi:hypothetical protein
MNYTSPLPKMTYPEPFYTGQNQRIEELNDRIYERVLTDSPLEPNFDPRPVPTKYVLFPVMNSRTNTSSSPSQWKLPYVDYNPQTNFYSGDSTPPFNGYSNKIDLENALRNQYFVLQHGSPQSTYIPDSNSELYKVSVISRPSQQPYPGLFSQTQWDTTPHPNVSNSLIGRDVFFNHTKNQLRNS